MSEGLLSSLGIPEGVASSTRYDEGQEQCDQVLVTWEVLISQDEAEDKPMANRQYEIQLSMQEPEAYAASTNPDIMYLHETIKPPDQEQFKKAMDKELGNHVE